MAKSLKLEKQTYRKGESKLAFMLVVKAENKSITEACENKIRKTSMR